MIDPETLMLGNIIRSKMIPEPLTVTGIMLTKIFVNNAKASMTLKSLEHVPLSVEWLGRFGFKARVEKEGEIVHFRVFWSADKFGISLATRSDEVVTEGVFYTSDFIALHTVADLQNYHFVNYKKHLPYVG